MAVQNKQTAKHRQAMIVVLFACNLPASLMQSLMNVALDYVSAEYHVSLSEANLRRRKVDGGNSYPSTGTMPLSIPAAWRTSADLPTRLALCGGR